MTDPLPRPTSTQAVISAAFGGLAWMFLPFVGGIVAIITGHLARAEIKRSNGGQGGDGFALIGLVLGYANVATCITVTLVFGLFFKEIYTEIRRTMDDGRIERFERRHSTPDAKHRDF